MRGAAFLLLAFACDATQAQAPVQRAAPATGPAPQAPEQPPEPEASLGPRAHVLLVTFGDFPEDLATAIAEGLTAELQVEVTRLPPLELPADAYYPPRRRYRADELLDHLRAHLRREPPSVKVLGFTTVDISTSARGRFDWGVFGLGDVGGRASVISTFRLRRHARDAEHVRFRVVTTAIHEVGHTLGLRHCTEDRCVMNDAHGSIATVDRSTGHLGPECRREVERRTPRPRL